MPKTKFQNIIFTLIMAFIMVYAMICYNISLNKGQMSNEVFLLAFHEMVIMWPAAFILEFFAVEKLATKLAFRFIRPGVTIRSLSRLRFRQWLYVLCVRQWVWLQHCCLKIRVKKLLRYGCKQQLWISQWHCAGKYFLQDRLQD